MRILLKNLTKKFPNRNKKIKEEQKLYATTPQAITEVINTIKNKHNFVMNVKVATKFMSISKTELSRI